MTLNTLITVHTQSLKLPAGSGLSRTLQDSPGLFGPIRAPTCGRRLGATLQQRSDVVLMWKRREWRRGDRWRQLGKTSSLLPTRSWRLGSPQITNYLQALQNKPENNFPEVQVQDKPPLKCPQQENKRPVFTGWTNTDGRGLLVKQRLKDGDGRSRETDDDAALIAVWKLSLQDWN